MTVSLDCLAESQDENISIVEEAAALRYTLRKQQLEHAQRKQLDLDTVVTHILSDVQQQQDIELAKAVANLGKMVSVFAPSAILLCIFVHIEAVHITKGR